MEIKSGVYRIVNRDNNKSYIGSTSRSCSRRYKEHLNKLDRGRHVNRLLQKDYLIYGREAFYLEILEFVEDIEDLIEIEQKWLLKVKPEYNVIKLLTVNIHTKKHRIKQSKTHEKFRYHLVSPEGIHFCITNLTGFARDNNLADTHLHSVVWGKYPAYKGWRGSVIKEDGSLLFPLVWEPKNKYLLVSPEGTHQCVWNLSEFAADNKLSQPNLREVVNGNRREEKGWGGSVILNDGTTPHLNREPEDKYHLISPEGIEMCTSNLKEFCKDYTLIADKMYAVASDRRDHHKGWRIRRIVLGYTLPIQFNALTRKESVMFARTKARFHLTSPEGIEMSTFNLNAFAKEYNYTSSKLYQAAKTNKPYKGWKVKEIEC